MKPISKIRREFTRIRSQMPWNRNADAKEVRIGADELGKIGALPYLREKNRFFHRIILPTQTLIMLRGIPFTEERNPFVAALSQGISPLAEHYEHFQPTNLAQMYGLKESGRNGETLNQFSEPWLPGTTSSQTRGEVGLSADHGISHYGPVSKQKLEREMRRLTATLASIEKNGFDPIRYGDIKGYFMRSGNQYRFQIAGGKHRVAVLAHLGWESIPVRMRNGWPRLIDRNDHMNWPRVAQGQIDPELALEIFDCYFV